MSAGWSSPSDTERVTALRTLLRHPLGGTTHTKGIHRHAAALAQLCADEFGWRLDVGFGHPARLYKQPGPGHVTRGYATRSGKPFGPRHYAILCLLLGVLDGAGERVSAFQLFRDVAARAGAIPGLDFDPEAAFDRRLFVHGAEAAEDMGVLRALEREEPDRPGRPGGPDLLVTDVLWAVEHGVLARLLAGRYTPASLALDLEHTSQVAEVPDGASVRQRCLRALVDEPVVYVDELDPEAREWLGDHLPEVEAVLGRLGLAVERRAEGWVTVDLEAELTDLEWPTYGAAQTAALRLSDALAERGLASQWAMAAVIEFCASLAEEYAGYWPKDAATSAGARRLAEDAVAILAKFKLIAGCDPILPRPAVYRFAVSPRGMSPSEVESRTAVRYEPDGR